MYRLIHGQLQHIEEIVTPRQTALVTTTVASVVGYDDGDPIEFETIPVKEELEGYIAELHYTEGQLIWFYTPLVTVESRVEQLEAENTTLKVAMSELAEAQEADKISAQLALAELAEMVAGGGTNG